MFVLNKKVRFSSQVLTRLYGTKGSKSSSDVRKRFIEYFVNGNDHIFIPSSPIKPISDATIPFVNAGMVQFKSVLQGQCLPPTPLAVNSQKCARVGGKHNDLDIVGSDGYHHTFFEMLGNWSFGSCNKRNACEMAWQLLTGPYCLHPSRLYVTYFGGDDEMNLEPDLECQDVWRQLGVEENHILPFGSRENFWEMGLVGPCGPCTEIHVDHIPERLNAGDRVNSGFSDLTELWNIVFIQFNRNSDGSLTPLKQSHVDTGMGFERLLALLNGSQSNYDTDLFKPLLEVIHKVSQCSPYSGCFDERDEAFKKDCAYRILCDHSRLLTVALADGVVPNNEYKLRWVLRRALNISNDVMNTDERLLVELSNYVAESLYSIYPEVGKRLKKVQRVILHEAEVYKALKVEIPKNWVQLVEKTPEIESLLQYGSNPTALSSAYKKMSEHESQEVSPELAFHLYESHGMNAVLISKMADLLGKKFSIKSYENQLEKVKWQSKFSSSKEMTDEEFVSDLSASKIPTTLDNLMYEYDRVGTEYTFPTVSAKIVALLVEGKLQSEAVAGTKCGVILDRTNFYYTAGGQVNDVGEIVKASEQDKCTLSVNDVTKIGGYVIHFGNLNGRMQVGDRVTTKINASTRTACMRNHTLAHLINGEIQHIFDAPVQEKCVVQPSFLKLTYLLHGEELNVEDVEQIEKAVNNHIEDQLPVSRVSVTQWEIPTGTTLLTEETYPVDNIHILDVKRGMKIVSREACCGTHVLNTQDIGRFCIVEVIKKSKYKGICAVTGSDAEEAVKNSQKLLKDVDALLQDLHKTENFIDSAMGKVLKTKSASPQQIPKVELRKVYKEYSKIKDFIHQNNRRFSYVAFMKADASLKEVISKINELARKLMEQEVKLKAQDAKFLVHRLTLSKYADKVQLNKFTRLVNIPIMLFSLDDEELKIRCCIPKAFISENFNALLWMNEAVLHLVKSELDAVVSQWKHLGQSSTVQTRLITFKGLVGPRMRQERLKAAIEAAEHLAQLQIDHLKQDQEDVA